MNIIPGNMSVVAVWKLYLCNLTNTSTVGLINSNTTRMKNKANSDINSLCTLASHMPFARREYILYLTLGLLAAPEVHLATSISNKGFVKTAAWGGTVTFPPVAMWPWWEAVTILISTDRQEQHTTSSYIGPHWFQ